VRLFVAVDVGAVDAAAPAHLTLAFLGEVDPAELPRLADALAPLGADERPFALALEGVGAFPSADRPRVVYRAVTDGRVELERLAGRVRAALDAAGIAYDPTPFHPHATLFRVRGPVDRRRAAALLGGSIPAPSAERGRVDAFRLKESVRSGGGVVHRTVTTFPLVAR